MGSESKSSFFRLPATRLGWWAFSLAAVFVLVFILNSLAMDWLPLSLPSRRMILPSFGIMLMTGGLVSGILGLIALILKKERSGLVWFTLVPGAFTLMFILGEFLYPH